MSDDEDSSTVNLTYHPLTHGDLDAFLTRFPPSQTTDSLGPWLSVWKPMSVTSIRGVVGYPEMMQKCNRAISDCEENIPLYDAKLRGMRREMCRQEVLDIAQSHGDVSGKWILFPFVDRVDEIWARIARATREGKLGPCSKVATRGLGTPVRTLVPLCVYVRSFVDVEDVKRVLRQLQEMGIVKRGKEDPDTTRMGCSFKPDVFTRLGFYHGKRREGDGVKMCPILYKIDDFPVE